MPAYHHDNVREDVTVLVNEGTDAASSQGHLFTESSSLRVFFVFLFCNYIFSFYFLSFLKGTHRVDRKRTEKSWIEIKKKFRKGNFRIG